MKKHTVKIVVGLIVLIFVAAFWYANRAAQVANEGVALGANIKGNPEAQVKLVEYSDFQCPACAQVYPVVKDILNTYGDRLAFEYKHFPLISIHPLALPAAQAAEAAGQQGKFFEMHDKLFDNQPVWSRSTTPTVFFEQYASEIGLDLELFRRHSQSSVIEDRITSEFAEARSLGFTGTPTFTLNGERIQFSSYAELVELVRLAIEGDSSTSSQTVTPESEVIFGL